jgi:putative membrane protein
VTGPDGQPGAAPGAQPERTALAWRRTALALAAGALVGGRVLEPWLGPLVWLPVAVGVLAAVALARAGGRRAARWSAVLDASSDARVPGGGPLAVTAAGAVVLGGAALVVVLRHAAAG